jgi:phosphopantothenoylcysteine synthetase/decarboxylase
MSLSDSSPEAAGNPEAPLNTFKWQADFRRLLIVVTGSLNAVSTPSRLFWLRTSFPELELRVVVTRSAEKFVTRTALSVTTGTSSMLDEWDDTARPGAMHMALVQWAEAILVIPASLNYMARVALGLADSPSVLAIQCTGVPVVIAPSLPPGGWESPAVKQHLRCLAQRPNVSVIHPLQGLSLTTGRLEAYLPPSLQIIFEDLGWIAKKGDTTGDPR